MDYTKEKRAKIINEARLDKSLEKGIKRLNIFIVIISLGIFLTWGAILYKTTELLNVCL